MDPLDVTPPGNLHAAGTGALDRVPLNGQNGAMSVEQQPMSVQQQPMSVEQQLREHILQNFMYAGGGEELTDELALFESGIIDSTGVLELVAFIEQTYAIQVDDSDLLPENFGTIADIARFVRGRQG